MNVAIILAGGAGSRVGGDRPKQFIEVFERPVLAYTIDIYQSNPLIDGILVVCHEEWIQYCNKMIETEKQSKVRWIVEGGKDFQHSVINGIERLRNELNADDIVLIHYGASPFTSARMIEDCIRVTKEKGPAFSATPCYQLMGSNDGAGISANWVDRDRLVQIACPYGFRFDYLLNIYKRADEQGLLETVEPHTTSLVYALGDTMYQSYGDQTNIKITTMEDIRMFAGYLLVQQYNGKVKPLDVN